MRWGYWIANRNRMLPISIILVSAEVGQARLRVKPGDDTAPISFYEGGGANVHSMASMASEAEAVIMTMLRTAYETSLAAAIAVAAGLGFAGSAAAQNYPVKPIR